MATAAAAVQDGETPGEAGAGKTFGRKRFVMLAAPAMLVLALGGAWFSGVLPRLLGTEQAGVRQEKAAKPAMPVFVDLPEMVANLSGNGHRPSYVKLVARIEVTKPEDAERVKQAMPRLQDLFQTYLREMRPEELHGAAGTYRLREELIARANVAVAPARVVNVLFAQMLVQ